MTTITQSDQTTMTGNFYKDYKDVYGVLNSVCETIGHAMLYYQNGVQYQRVNGNKTIMTATPPVYDQILGYIRSELKAKMIDRDPIGYAFFKQNQEAKNHFIDQVQELVPRDVISDIYTEYFQKRQQFLAQIVHETLFPINYYKYDIENFKVGNNRNYKQCPTGKCNLNDVVDYYPKPYSYPLGNCALSDVIGYRDDPKDYDYVGPLPIDPNRQKILYGLYKPGCLRETNFYVLN